MDKIIEFFEVVENFLKRELLVGIILMVVIVFVFIIVNFLFDVYYD